MANLKKILQESFETNSNFDNALEKLSQAQQNNSQKLFKPRIQPEITRKIIEPVFSFGKHR